MWDTRTSSGKVIMSKFDLTATGMRLGGIVRSTYFLCLVAKLVCISTEHRWPDPSG